MYVHVTSFPLNRDITATCTSSTLGTKDEASKDLKKYLNGEPPSSIGYSHSRLKTLIKQPRMVKAPSSKGLPDKMTACDDV